ncbi:phosphate ABC transporter permease [Halorubrum aethiopicum]|uniref:phosphate ABC transporter permease n=1 Tax=Halorubrum aethiopicum TaxID=1758255 RepID=UPI000B31B017|nr:phosphate ABC transporter permease [Halorubrum aethiopicum]
MTATVEADRDDPETAEGSDSAAAGHAPTGDAPTGDASIGHAATGRRTPAASLDGRVRAAPAIAAVAVAVATALRVAYNVPFDPVALPARTVPAADAVAGLVTGAALAALALASARPVVRIGLLFSGVFGVLATVSDAAAVTAAVAVPGGVAVAFAGALGRPTTYPELRRRALALAFPVAAGVSLAATTWGLGTGARATGSAAFLLSVTLLVGRADGDRVALAAGAAGLLCVVAASAAAPYVTGSALLAGFGVVGSPHLLVATAAAGGLAALVAGVHDGDGTLALGAGTLLAAGVPATPSAALAACLGAALAALDPDELLAAPEVSR